MKVQGVNYFTVAELVDMLKAMKDSNRSGDSFYIQLYSNGSGYLMEATSDYDRYHTCRAEWDNPDRMERALVLYLAELETKIP
jgi:hypothetical protein